MPLATNGKHGAGSIKENLKGEARASKQSPVGGVDKHPPPTRSSVHRVAPFFGVAVAMAVAACCSGLRTPPAKKSNQT
jgi:hypothetical protein